jgi:hypothetical protein
MNRLNAGSPAIKRASSTLPTLKLHPLRKKEIVLI